MSITDEPIDPLYGVPKVADLFDVKPATVRDWIEQGKIQATKINGRYKIKRSEVIRYGNSKFG